ncbi:hypothetical protein PWO95_05170 [Weissella paramesenteroides]|uniref:DUF3800 domain-containing protein n=1 Tax=Weissella paramesenteroides TaxID=1249 RepID=A0ABD4XK16_WEIPA|nr:DUF3800 domain-containing protein [Weissella paramesenteroides]MDF8369414.1 DUF3800 domain-containing protein [Weissella paramesenteroides]MDF8371427.1 DUF3800 domain-containing protein [Weissella paramesenteroides]WEA52054.1 hypothetical protein PWO95_05170 [Weissella paramesenteroides]
MDYTESYKYVKNSLKVTGINKKFYLYYDETNNFRSFKVDDKGFNADEHAYFILGGIAIKTDPHDIVESVDSLFSKFDMQANAQEIKFKHINKGSKNFIELMDKNRVKVFLNWLYENDNVFIHYNYFDNFYFSVVDIVDSLPNSMLLGLEFNRELKDRLYQIMKTDKEYFTNLFVLLGYPNVNNPKLLINKIIEKINEINLYGDDFYVEYLRQILKSAINSKFPLLENNVEGELIDNYSSLYTQSIYSFPNSHHTFDHEYNIESLLANNPIYVNEKLVDYIFDDSKRSRLLQLSDLTVGILRYWMSFLEKHSASEISNILNSLSSNQETNIRKLQQIMNNSLSVSGGFKVGSGSNDFEKKVYNFLTYKF